MSKERVPAPDQEHVDPRIAGTETEFGYRLTSEDSTPLTKKSSLFPSEYPRVGEFLPNGGRFYVDCGFPEYATPECRNIEELIAHEIAGEELVRELVETKFTDIKLHKRCVTPGKPAHTNGYHENYSTDIDIWGESRNSNHDRNALATHFATRSLFTGAGTMAGRAFTVAQKPHGIYESEGDDTLYRKALVNTRWEHHTGDPQSQLRRLHVISGDPNISPYAMRLKFGSTSSVLRLLEHGYDLEELFLRNPVTAAKAAGGTVKMANTPLLMQNGTLMKPIDIQESLWEKVRDLSQHIQLPEEETHCLYAWRETIDALKKLLDTDTVTEPLRLLDWYAKYEFINRGSGKPAEMDARYDRLEEGVGHKLRRDGRRFSPYMPEVSAIENAKNEPPGNRARLRGSLVIAAYRHSLSSSFNGSAADWGAFAHNGHRQLLGAVNRSYESDEIARIARTFRLHQYLEDGKTG